MADQFDNTNRGALFVNDKGDNPKRPDYKGSLNVGGVEYWLSGWKQTSKAGAKYLSVKVEPKEQRAEQPSQKPPDPNDDIPMGDTPQDPF